eukprot:scaffold439_cov415-Prasinococcus_capsulatus_cf.AAC.30
MVAFVVLPAPSEQLDYCCRGALSHQDSVKERELRGWQIHGGETFPRPERGSQRLASCRSDPGFALTARRSRALLRRQRGRQDQRVGQPDYQARC